jgi:hypothetical protein
MEGFQVAINSAQRSTPSTPRFAHALGAVPEDEELSLMADVQSLSSVWDSNEGDDLFFK